MLYGYCSFTNTMNTCKKAQQAEEKLSISISMPSGFMSTRCISFQEDVRNGCLNHSRQCDAVLSWIHNLKQELNYWTLDKGLQAQGLNARTKSISDGVNGGGHYSVI